MKQSLSKGFISGLLLGTFLGVVSRLVLVKNLMSNDKLKDLSLFGGTKRIKS